MQNTDIQDSDFKLFLSTEAPTICPFDIQSLDFSHMAAAKAFANLTRYLLSIGS